MLAAGPGWTSPEVAIPPRPDTPMAALPEAGQGIVGAVHGITVCTGGGLDADTAGTGRR